MAATHLPKGSDLEKSTHADHSGAFTTQRLCVADSAAPQYLAPPADAAAATADAPSFAAPVLRANLTGITEGKATYMVGGAAAHRSLGWLSASQSPNSASCTWFAEEGSGVASPTPKARPLLARHVS